MGPDPAGVTVEAWKAWVVGMSFWTPVRLRSWSGRSGRPDTRPPASADLAPAPDGTWNDPRARLESGRRLAADGELDAAAVTLARAEADCIATLGGYSWSNRDQEFGFELRKVLPALGRKHEAARALAQSVAITDPTLLEVKPPDTREPLRSVLAEIGTPEEAEGLVQEAHESYVAAVHRELVRYGVGRPAGDFTLWAQRGKVVLLNFWGTW
jgi:hypothetical protein